MKKVTRILGEKNRIKCKWCDESFTPLLRYCPACGHSNEDFFLYEPHPELRQKFIELWIDREVYNAVEIEAKAAKQTEREYIQELIEIHISRNKR